MSRDFNIFSRIVSFNYQVIMVKKIFLEKIEDTLSNLQFLARSI